MSRKRILGLILLCLGGGIFAAGFMWYAGVLLKYQTEILVVCMSGIILLFCIQCNWSCKKSSKRIDALLDGMGAGSSSQGTTTQSQLNKD